MRQPDDPGLDPPPAPEDPFAGLKSQTWVRVYRVIVVAAIAFASWSAYARPVPSPESVMTEYVTTLATGVIVGLVLVQLYPPSARVGVWIVNKSKELIARIRS